MRGGVEGLYVRPARANDVPENRSAHQGDLELRKGPLDPGHAAPDQYKAFLDRQADVYEDQRRTGLARLGLRPGQAVLDAGCGPGTDTFDLEKLVLPGGRVVGVDLSDDMIAAARRRAVALGSGVELVVSDICSLDLPDEVFDLARCVLVLLHVRDPIAALSEMVRVLRPGGQVVCIDVDHQMDALDATDVGLAERALRGTFAGLQNPRIGRQLRGLFIAVGLIQVQVEVIPEVSTSWAQFTALPGEGVFDGAVGRGEVTQEELDGLRSDLEARDADGRFFSCAVRMRCSGIKPG